jgi:hypothetical protein
MNAVITSAMRIDAYSMCVCVWARACKACVSPGLVQQIMLYLT